KSRRNVSCFSRTTTGTPALASSSPSTMPAGPPPTTQTVVSIVDLQSQPVIKSTPVEILPPSLQKLPDDFDALRHVRLAVGDHVGVEETLPDPDYHECQGLYRQSRREGAAVHLL